jgi:hypothetical protein
MNNTFPSHAAGKPKTSSYENILYSAIQRPQEKTQFSRNNNNLRYLTDYATNPSGFGIFKHINYRTSKLRVIAASITLLVYQQKNK